MDAPDRLSSSAAISAPCPVADTMLRVQAMLARGAIPSFEAVFAVGDPGDR